SNAIKVLKAKIDNSKRVGEPISVIAHSHGTAILLAAAQKRPLGLEKILLVGSDISKGANIDAFFASARIVYNHRSMQDWTVRFNNAGGAAGFGSVRLVNGRWQWVPDEIPEKFIQVVHPGTPHTGNYEQTRPGEIPWMSRVKVRTRYAGDLAIRRPRDAPEGAEWKDSYKKLRTTMGLEWTVPLPFDYDKPYSP
ncbi:MAG: hypothetical protein LC667_09250, partial [Thioalkalivibrio sp.]|nr:hypothetical protein [Thioalkalivibrio sp.]